MYYNEALYTTLTWAQLAIGLTIGLLPIVLTAAIKLTLERRSRTEGDVFRSPEQTSGMPEQQMDAPLEATKVLRGAYYILRALTATERPLFFCSILKAVHDTQSDSRDESILSGYTVRTVLERLLSHGNIRLCGNGFSITEDGVKLYSRLARISESVAQRTKARAPHHSSGARRRGGIRVTPATLVHARRSTAFTRA